MRRSLVLSASAIGAGFGFALLACGGEDAPASAPVTPVPTATVAPAPALPTVALSATGIEPSWMDTTVDPCTDFFAYACGGFVKSSPIPADRASWSVTDLIDKENEDFLKATLEKDASSPADADAKKLGDYYASCMDEDAIEKAKLKPIQAILDNVQKVHDVPSLQAAIVQLHTHGIFPLFAVGPMQDLKDATLMITGMDQSGISLPDRDYYLSDDPSLKTMRDFLVGHVTRMLTLGGMSAAEAKTASADVLRIETEIAKIEQDKVARRDPYKIYNRVDRDGLTSLAPTFPWTAYFTALGIPDAKAVSVNDKGYFQGVEALMHKEPASAWRHYLRFRVLRAEANALSKAFVNENFALRQQLTGQKELPPRWKRCVRDVDGELGELLGQSYVASKFGGDSKARAQELTGWIQNAMRSDLKAVAWMDADTKTAALAKMDKMGSKVGYPDKWRVYPFPVTRASYAANVDAGDQFEQHRQLAKIGKPVDRTEWGMTPPTVNAYFDPSMNEIVLPAGELQPPFFSKDFYPPVNIGDEGANTIGHEITHGFDDEGSQFDANGNLTDWWSGASKAKFKDATKCVQDQYSGYEAVPGVKLNGELTSGENIADIGGVKLGFYAMQEWQKAHPDQRKHVDGFTDEKLYFLAYSQGWCSKETPEILQTMARSNPHSPPRWRVNGPMTDTPAFATAYQCKAGTPMNNGKACVVW